MYNYVDPPNSALVNQIGLYPPATSVTGTGGQEQLSPSLPRGLEQTRVYHFYCQEDPKEGTQKGMSCTCPVSSPKYANWISHSSSLDKVGGEAEVSYVASEEAPSWNQAARRKVCP